MLQERHAISVADFPQMYTFITADGNQTALHATVEHNASHHLTTQQNQQRKCS